MESSTHDRWYRYRRTAGTTLAGPWILSWIISTSLLRIATLTDWQRIALSFLPLPFFAWFLRRFVHHMRASDELQRRIQLEALAIAFPLAVATLMTLGLLQTARLLPQTGWSYTDLWVYLALFYLLGRSIAQRRYS